MKNAGWILRIVLMLGALGGVFYAMKQLNTRGVSKELFHLDGDAQYSKNDLSILPQFDLCITRVKDVQFQWDGRSYNIQNSGKTWKANELELPPVDMEKWLVLLCRVKAERRIDLATSTKKYIFPDQIVFNYVDGQTIKFGIETPAFLFGEKAFYSRQFLEMINTLKTMISRK